MPHIDNFYEINKNETNYWVWWYFFISVPWTTDTLFELVLSYHKLGL